MNWNERLVRFGAGRWVYALVSMLLLAPCYWQPRLQAGDLSTYMYNSWVSQAIESGRTEGMLVVRQTTDILFDVILERLFHLVGPEIAQRIAVSIAVLVFVWGAFAFVTAVVGRRCWHVMPCLAILAYGWVFHMGFYNIYLSLGLCFWAMALAWKMELPLALLSVPLFILGYVAHALPAIWTFGLLTYVYLARRLTPFHRAGLTVSFVMTLVALKGILGHFMETHGSAAQASLYGLNAVWSLDSKYYWVLMGLVAVWALWFLALLRGDGARQVVTGIPFQLCVIGSAAVFLLPGTVLIPGFFHAISYTAERMSIGVAVCVCALLGTVRPRKLEKWALAVVAATFFFFVYVDERAMNRYEERIQDLLSRVKLPVTLTLQ